jgi:serine/threonine protein kinase
MTVTMSTLTMMPLLLHLLLLLLCAGPLMVGSIDPAPPQDIPWPSIALARSLHKLSTYNPEIKDYCDFDFDNQDFVTMFNGYYDANFADIGAACPSLGHTLKVRLGLLDVPEKGYEFPSVECLHLFQLDKSPNSPAENIPARAASRYAPPRFPRALYLHNRHPLFEGAVCVSEYLQGVPLVWHVAKLRSDDDVADFALAMIDLVATLSEHSIMHRDISPSNIVVQETKDSFGGSIFRIILFDFTWAISPGIKQYEDPPRFLNSIYGHPSKASDVYSVGYVLHDMLSMYCDMDTRWLNPVVKAMITAPPPNDLNLKIYKFTALKELVMSLRLKKLASAAHRVESSGNCETTLFMNILTIEY